MPTYKLTYFNVTGLGESLRYMLNHCGIKFEDVRLNFDDWPKHKPSMFISYAIISKKETIVIPIAPSILSD